MLQREVERRMFERLDYIRLRPQRVLDSGCGVGHGLKLLRRRYPEADFLGVDFAPGVLGEAKREESLFERARRLVRRLVSGSGRSYVCADSRGCRFAPPAWIWCGRILRLPGRAIRSRRCARLTACSSPAAS